jgi:hypothetical protein
MSVFASQGGPVLIAVNQTAQVIQIAAVEEHALKRLTHLVASTATPAGWAKAAKRFACTAKRLRQTQAPANVK